MNRPRYCYGDCRIDPQARELHRGDTLVALSPKVFDCLVYLIEHRDRAVGRDELIAAVWGKADVTDTLLGQTILKARRAIGDDGNEQAAIRTVPRFGYRWIGELAQELSANPEVRDPVADEIAAMPTPPADGSGDAQHVQRSARPWPRIATIAIIIAAFLAALTMIGFRLATNVATAPPPAGVAADPELGQHAVTVMPAKVSAIGEWGWLRLGLMDLIASRVRRAGIAVPPSDNVIAALRTSAPHSDAQHNAATTVRNVTGTAYLAEPAVSQSNDGWTVTIGLQGPDGAVREIVSHGADPIGTARDAANRLLVALGSRPDSDESSTTVQSLAELRQHIEAALLTGDFTTARRLVETAQPGLRDNPEIRLQLATVDFRTGQYAAAAAVLQQLLAQTPSESDPSLRARALFLVGAIAVREDRNADGIKAFKESIGLTETQHEPLTLGRAYMGVAMAEVNLARFEDAASNFSRARVALAQAGDALALARVDANEGILENARGRPAQALPVLQRAAERLRRFGAVNDLALTVIAQMKAQLLLLDPRTALTVSDALLPLRDQLANARTRGNFDLQREHALDATGRLKEAQALLDQLEGDRSLDDQAELPGGIASEAARHRLRKGDVAGAIELSRKAVEHLLTPDEASERAHAWLTLCRSLRAAGQIDAVASETAKFSEWARAYDGLPTVIPLAALARGEQAWTRNDRSEAFTHFEDALRDVDRWAVPRDLFDVVAAYGSRLIADGNMDRASTVIGRIARWGEQDFGCAVLLIRLYHALGQTDTAAARTALEHARALAGERALPSITPTSPPGTPTSNSNEALSHQTEL